MRGTLPTITYPPRQKIRTVGAPFVLLESTRRDTDNYRSFLFREPVKVLTARDSDTVETVFKKTEEFLKKGFWVAGFFSYELGYSLEPAVGVRPKATAAAPLIWLGVFNEPLSIDHRRHTQTFRLNETHDTFDISRLKATVSEDEYCRALSKIKHYLRQGDTYQVNFTFPLDFTFTGSVNALYAHLKRRQATSYTAWINTGSDTIISCSPELFFSTHDGTIVTRPMKGTAQRGASSESDARQRQWLSRSRKNKAENIMIVDLLRNDLGKVSQKGSVRVHNLFSIEEYKTVFQMTSTISARLKPHTSLGQLMRALFPSGSVTGAPKIRTMQIINELEKKPRGIYTGAIGYVAPDRTSCFNVAIRTIRLAPTGCGTLGIGSGIVYDSIDTKEYAEALLKAQFLTETSCVRAIRYRHKRFSLVAPRITHKRRKPLFLFESILRTQPGEYYLRNEHCARLKQSCEYFSFPYAEDIVNNTLHKLDALLGRTGQFKVKIVISRSGAVSAHHESLRAITQPVPITVSKRRTNSSDPFLYHKTSHRRLYEEERQKALASGFWEVVFFNEREELTEGSISNVFLLTGGTLYTPPIASGLLKGVLRAHLIQTNRVKEKTLYADDIRCADKIYIGNSVRGLLEARIGEHTESALDSRAGCTMLGI